METADRDSTVYVNLMFTKSRSQQATRSAWAQSNWILWRG